MGPSELLLSNAMNRIDSGKKLVRVFRANPSCCLRCRQMDGRVVSVDSPALCTHPHCKCSVVKEYR